VEPAAQFETATALKFAACSQRCGSIDCCIDRCQHLYF